MRTRADMFVYRFIPTTVNAVNYHNLVIGHADNAFFNTIPSFLTEVSILNSMHIRWLTVPQRSNISTLNVSFTGLRRIDMEKNDVLTEFIVASGNIAEISPSIRNLQASREICITNCLIESLDLGTFCDMSKLQVLNVYGNRITHIQNSAKSNCSLYDSLEMLTLSQNFLQSLNMELFNPFRILTLLNINENNIGAVFGKYKTDTDLRLFLSKNRIKTINVCEWNVPLMVWLDLRHNSLTAVPNCLEKLNGVRDLDLSFNQLRNVTVESFAKMDSLLRLIMSSNNMTTISFNTTRYPVNLKTVWITENKLTELDLSLVAVPSLEIYVDNNFIENVDVSNVSKNVTLLQMKNNPIDCSWNTVEERLNLTCIENRIV
ncbi:toll-like receptor 7 [Anopheles maculipalpis]|uniref:toll-like receptor 7 n=1 Tax=Anopheles maculipalpis TaxID=1496333 RepID=UPI002158D2E3|nr:toll-like receptor 7 [Anopheles maculipalpis]